MTFSDLRTARDLLGVSDKDDAATVRQAWMKLVRSYHPDLAKSDPVAANRRLAEINAGFDLVSAAIPAEDQPSAAQARPAQAPQGRNVAPRGRDIVAIRPQAPKKAPRPVYRWSAADQAYANSFNEARRIFDRQEPKCKHVAYA